MRRAGKIIASALVPALFAILAVRELPSASRRKPGGAVAPGEAPSGGAVAYGWREGSRYRYGFGFDDDESTTLVAAEGAPSVDTRVHLHGEWVITPRARRGATQLVGLTVTRLDRDEVSLQGHAVPAELAGEETLFELGEGGEVVAVYGSQKEMSLRVNLVRMMLADLETHRPPPGLTTWTGHEPTLHGQAATEVTWSAGHVEKIRRSYVTLRALPLEDAAKLEQKVAHRATTELAAGGWPVRVHAEERTDAARSDGKARFGLRSALNVELLAIEPAPPAPGAPEGLARLGMDELVTSAAVEAELLDQRIDGLTWADVDTGLRLSLAPDQRWVWRTTGLLLRDPTLCAKLVPLFTRADATATQRTLILDVLAAVGHGPAQAAMREIVASSQARDDEQAYLRYVQSFSFVAHPDGETTRFLADEQAGQTGERRLAAAYALGSAASGTADPDAVARIEETLRRGMSDATLPGERAGYVAALGNTRRPENLALLHEIAAGPDDVNVRIAATRALGNLPDEHGVTELLELAGAAQRYVQRIALYELASRQLAVETRGRVVQTVADLAVAGRIDTTNLAPALDLLQTMDVEARRPALQALQPLAFGDPGAAQRIARLLGG